MQEKVCTKCNVSKPATTEFFSIHPGGKYGLQSKCKPCICALTESWRMNNKEKQKKLRAVEYEKNFMRILMYKQLRNLAIRDGLWD